MAKQKKPPTRLVSKTEQRPTAVKSKKWSPTTMRTADERVRMGAHDHHQLPVNGHICKTGGRGQTDPGGRSIVEIVVDASEGFIPLWAQGSVLKWRFDESSMQAFQTPDAAKAYIQELMGHALNLWGDASPVRFTYAEQPYDFEVVFTGQDDCQGGGCVLASAFFPNAGQNTIYIYPKMFEQTYQEQVETMAHEFGHVLGLRHFFANISETAFDSEIYGEHTKFSIMNYGADSFMTETDRSDLRNLYAEVWDGRRTEINGTVVRLFKPYSSRAAPDCVC